MKKVLLLFISFFLLTTITGAQSTIYFPKFLAFEGENDRKKAIVKATILLQQSINYLYDNHGGEIIFYGNNYEIGYFSKVIKSNWREMDLDTKTAFQELQIAIKGNKTATVDEYLNNPKSPIYQILFTQRELTNAILGEDLHLFVHYTKTVLNAFNKPSNLPEQKFVVKARNIEIQAPTIFVVKSDPPRPYIKFSPEAKANTVRFVAPRMPNVTYLIPSQDQMVFDYINEHYLSLAKINRPTTASKLLYALDLFTSAIAANDSNSDAVKNAANSIRNLVFPKIANNQTYTLWQTIEKWNGCRALFDGFDLFTTLQTYSNSNDAPSLKFENCIFDGNLVHAWEANDNYQFEQSSLFYIGANRLKKGRVVVDFSSCIWLDILGDGVHFHNNVKSTMLECSAGNVGRGAITATGQNADIRIDGYTDISYNSYYKKLSSVSNPDELGKVLVEVDSDATIDDVFFKLTNSVLYMAKIVDERVRKDTTGKEKGGYYELKNNTIKYSFKQSVPKSNVLIESCVFGTSTKNLSTKGRSSNLSFSYAANATIRECTFESTVHKTPYQSHLPNRDSLDNFVTINIQNIDQKWKNQRIEFIDCNFKNENGELYRAIMVDGKNAVDDIANNNTVIFKNASVEGNFHTGIQIGGGTVELNGLRAMKLSRRGSERAYFMRRSPSNSRLIMKNINFTNPSKFQFYYYYAAAIVEKTENTFEWEHNNVTLPQALNIIKQTQCANMGYIQFIGHRDIIGNIPNPNGVQTMGFYQDKYQGTTGCIWTAKQTGCINVHTSLYTINWLGDPTCSSNGK